MEVTLVSPAIARAAIAHRMLGPATGDDTLGGIRLYPHQLDGVARIQRLLGAYGGAMLADDVGLGKTYVALRVARDLGDPLVLAPAALRDGWARSAAAAGMAIDFVSFEALSRGAARRDAPFVIVDEAHHLRNRATLRYGNAASLCRIAPVLLLSATPVHNRLDDLRTQLGLFLGTRADAMSEEELARCVVRRTATAATAAAAAAAPPLPTVVTPRWIHVPDDSDCLDRILSLPPPLPPADGDDGGVLLAYTLARQWASSRAAFIAALRRRLATARAMEDSLAAGQRPSRRELATWCHFDGVQQLGMAGLGAGPVLDETAALLAQVRCHADALRELLAWLRATPDPDPGRARALGDALAAHPGERVVAFTEFTETARVLYRLMRPGARAALLTHAGAEVAGGRMTRRELLQRFALADRVSPAERVDLLITTDVLSEGVNLQAASVAIHLDIPWNPARLVQRVGRLRRLHAARDRVVVYMVRPPGPAERFLTIERRLREKLGRAARSVGVAGAILPTSAAGAAEEAAAAREERIAARLRSWRGPPAGEGDAVLVAAVRAVEDAALVCVADDGSATLSVVRGERVTREPVAVAEALLAAEGEEIAPSRRMLHETLLRLDRWRDRRRVADVVDLGAARVARARVALLRRVDTIAHRAPRHEQASYAPLLQRARVTASAVLSAGAERVLDELSRAALADGPWLRAIGEFGALHARTAAPSRRVYVVLLMVADR